MYLYFNRNNQSDKKFILPVRRWVNTSSFSDNIKSFMILTRRLIKGYPVQKFTFNLIQDPIRARDDLELKKIYNYYRLNMNNIYSMRPCDRILLHFIITRPYQTVVDELPHLLYYSKKYTSRLYTRPSLPCFNPRDYKIGDAVVHETKMNLEFKTYNMLTNNKAFYISNQFEHVNLKEHRLLLSVLYGAFASDFVHDIFLKRLTDCGFRIDDIFLMSSSECSSHFPTLESVSETFVKYYNIRWSEWSCDHYNYMEQQLRGVIEFSKDENELKSARKMLDLLELSRRYPGHVKNEYKVFKSLARFSKYNSVGEPTPDYQPVENPEDILYDSNFTSWWEEDF